MYKTSLRGHHGNGSLFSDEQGRACAGGAHPPFTFVDLFAGIGGFHLALSRLGGECVLASEIDAAAAHVYQDNFGMEVRGDITKIKAGDVAPFDFLCAGFPCQPFSKGGERAGFKDERGQLFFEIMRLVDYHKPKCLLLENVPNLATIDQGNTYAEIIRNLRNRGYVVPPAPLIISPHQLGMPIIRQRLYIPCLRADLYDGNHLDMNIEFQEQTDDIYALIDRRRKADRYYIDEYEQRILEMWNEFYQGIDLKVIGFPVYAKELRGTYDYSDEPGWKQSHLMKNRALYSRNKKFIDKWFRRHNELDWVKPTHTKFEWQAGTDCQDIYECLIQFRPSGVRVKRPDKFSTLVAINHPQIVGKYRRRLTPDETKRIQAFPEDFRLHHQDNIALKQLGNSVNVAVVNELANQLLLMGLSGAEHLSERLVEKVAA